MRWINTRKAKAGISLLVLGLLILISFLIVAPEQVSDVTFSIRESLGLIDDPFQANAIVNPPFPSLSYGIQAFLWWDGGEVGYTLDWTMLMNFRYVKQTFAWRDMERVQGEWLFGEADKVIHEVTRRDLKLVARLGKTPDWSHSLEGDFLDAPPDGLDLWRNYCFTVADRYQGQIAAYQIWNEPNLEREWGNQPPNAEDYVTLLQVCSEAIREADPEAILISAGLSPTGRMDDVAHRDDIYFDQMYRHDFQQYIDVVGVHAPGFSRPIYGPDDAERDGNGRWATFRRVEDLRKIMIAHNDATRQMAILEVGYTTDTVNPDYAWFAVDEETQAQYLEEAYLYAAEHWRPWVGFDVGNLFSASGLE